MSRKDPDYTRIAWLVSLRKARAAYCWNDEDWSSLLPEVEPGIFIAGFVMRTRPREANFAPSICDRLDILHYHRNRPTPTVWLANGPGVLAHESLHVYGFKNEALTDCVAIQLTAFTSQELGTSAAYGRALADKLWNNYSVAKKPKDYWSPLCHDGGPWDIDPKSESWPTPSSPRR